MKKFLCFLTILFVSCYPEDPVEPEPEPVKEEFASVVIDETCPERTGPTWHDIDRPTWEKIRDAVDNIETVCLELEFTNLEGEDVSGYFSSMQWPGSWTEE